MSFAFLPLYTGDYLRDTRHLSMSEHGAYLLMLTYCWDSKGPLPLDERRLFGLCNARSGDEMEAVRRVRADFFVEMEDGYYQPRMQREIERSEAISWQRSEAGKRGVKARQAKAKQLLSKRSARATTPTPTPTLIPTPTPTNAHRSTSGDSGAPKPAESAQPAPRSPNGSRIPDGFPANEQIDWCQQTRPDLDATETAAKFRDYWAGVPGQRGRKADWPATWRNFVRSERGGPRQRASPSPSPQRRSAAVESALSLAGLTSTTETLDVAARIVD